MRRRRLSNAPHPLEGLTIDPPYQLARSELVLGARLGSGGFGTVQRCTCSSFAGEELAVKRLPATMKPADAQLVRNEIRTWLALGQHEHVLWVRQPARIDSPRTSRVPWAAVPIHCRALAAARRRRRLTLRPNRSPCAAR